MLALDHVDDYACLIWKRRPWYHAVTSIKQIDELTRITGGAGVIPRVGRIGPRDQQFAGPGLAFREDADASAGRRIYRAAVLVPVDLGRGSGGLQCDTREVDVAAALDEQL